VKLGYTYDQTKVTSFDFVFSQMSPFRCRRRAVPLPGTPKNSVALGLEYATCSSRGELRYELDSHYQSKLLSSISETAGRAGYTMLDGGSVSPARIGWQPLRRQHHEHTGYQRHHGPTFWGNRTQAVVSRPRTSSHLGVFLKEK